MPKTDLTRLVCDYCSYEDKYNPRPASQEELDQVIKIVKKWRGVIRGDSDPAQSLGHKWYDSIGCLVKGSERDDATEKESLAHQEKLDEVLDKANAQLKASPYMVKN